MNKFNILWTTDNKDTVQHMLVMYAINSKANGWWDEIKFEACKACTDHFGVSKELLKLGIDVKFMGVPLTEYIRSEDKLLTI